LRLTWNNFYYRDWDRITNAFLKQLGWALGSIVLAFLVVALIIVATGGNPLVAYEALMRGAVLHADQILSSATPLIITGLSVAIAFRCGLFNIGAEGQLYMGSMAATIVGYSIALPFVVHPIACLGIGAVSGALWAAGPGLLKAYRGAHEVVTTMMLSYTAVLFCQWLVVGILKEPGQMHAQTRPVLETAWLPFIGSSDFLHIGFVIAILCAVGVYVFLSKTVLGYQLRAVGINQAAAEAGGINPKRMMVLALGISGGLAGIAGAGEILGYYHRFMDGWSGGLGFDGITVAVLGANNAFGVIGAASFFGFLRAGSLTMQTFAQVPVALVDVIQGLVVLFVAAPKIIEWLARRNVDYAKWMVKEPLKAVPLFLTAIMGFIGTFIGLAIGAANLSSNSLVAVSLLILGVVALAAFIGTLKLARWGPMAALVTSVAWPVVGACNLIYQQGPLLIPLFVLGTLGILLSAYSLFLPVRKGPVMEVEP
jgi:simple sugar transport system permease protein